MKRKLNDEEVIREYLTTSPNACYEMLYKRYVSKIYNRCLSITKDSAKAQDFTHDIFIKMFSRLDSFEARSTFSTWLYSISYNYCMDQIRLGNRLATTSLIENDDEDDTTVQPYTDDIDDSDESMQKLSWAMQSISQEESTLLRMKYQDGLDIKQIAAELKLNDSAVKMRLKRSRDKVREFYNRAEFAM